MTEELEENEKGPETDEGPPGEYTDYSTYERSKRAFGPMIAGLFLDLVDLATLGPVGIIAGLFVGFAVGYWICSVYNMRPGLKLAGGFIAGLYCMIPFTGPLPIATVVGALVRFFEHRQRPEKPGPVQKRKKEEGENVDVKLTDISE